MCFRKRIAAFIIDMVIVMLFYMLVNAVQIFEDFILHTGSLSKTYYHIYSICLLAVTSAFIGKDVIHGQSIGKKIMGIRVVRNDGSSPNVFQLFIRNLTIYFWPVEAILMLADKKRIGDIIAKTKVVLVDK